MGVSTSSDGLFHDARILEPTAEKCRDLAERRFCHIPIAGKAAHQPGDLALKLGNVYTAQLGISCCLTYKSC